MRIISEYDRNIPNLIIKGESRLKDPVYSFILRLKYMVASFAMLSMRAFTKIEVIGWHDLVEKKEREYPIVLAIWHGSLSLLILACKGLPYSVMDSPSTDGDLLLKLFNLFGFYTVRGSSHRRSVAGLLEHIKAVKRTKYGATAVDGPKGPARQTKPGIVLLARKTGAKIVATGVAFSHCFTLNKSWDKARFPIPFSKAVIYASEPFELDKNMSVEAASEYINSQIAKAHEQAELYLKQG